MSQVFFQKIIITIVERDTGKRHSFIALGIAIRQGTRDPCRY